MWSPCGGYVLDTSPASDDENSSKKNIKLLKVHGSVNFREYVTDTEGEEPRKDPYKDTHTPPKKPEYPVIRITDKYFKGINSKINCFSNSVYFVVLMSFLKTYRNASKMLWREAISALKNAERLVIIGCSLRDEDQFLQFALYHFGMKEGVEKYCIDIVDIEALIAQKLRTIF